MNYQQSEYIQRIYTNLIGRKISKVFYQELVYPTGNEYWNLSKNIHSVDMNIIFLLDDGKLIQLFWDNEFDCYGIGIKIINEIVTSKTVKTIEVTNNANWESILGSEILEIDINWIEQSKDILMYEDDELVDKTISKVTLPLTWQFKFIDTYFWISALEIKETGYLSFSADHLTVLFDYNIVREYGLINSK